MTATGRKVVLVPDVPDARAWLRRSNAFYNRWARGFFPPKLPAKLRAQARSTSGIAMGHYQFDNVPPGQYLVVLECWDDDYKKRFGVSEVFVAERTTHAEVKPMRRFTETR